MSLVSLVSLVLVRKEKVKKKYRVKVPGPAMVRGHEIWFG